MGGGGENTVAKTGKRSVRRVLPYLADTPLPYKLVIITGGRLPSNLTGVGCTGEQSPVRSIGPGEFDRRCLFGEGESSVELSFFLSSLDK